MGIYFNGKYYIKPQVATYVDDTALTPVGLVGSNVIGMMGPSKDGIPNTAYLLTSLNDATEIFGEGPLVDGVAMAFNGGAQYIWATRVGGAYDSTAVGAKFSAEPNQAIYEYNDSPNIPFRLLSKAYGSQANGIKVSTHSNSSDPATGVDVTVSAQGNVITGTGIYYDVLRIDNVSAEATFVIGTSSTQYRLTITQGSNSGVLDLVGVASTTDLIERIKETMAGASPASIDDASFTFTVLKEVPGVQLDAGSTLVQSQGIMRANVKAVFDWFNSGSQPYVYAEDSRGIFTSYITKNLTLFATSGNELAVFTFNMALANQLGAMGSIDYTSYAGVLAEIYEDLDLDLVVPIVDNYLGNTIVTGADSIFNAVLSHCKAMSTIKSEERIGLVGYQFEQGYQPSGTTSTSDGDADTLTRLLINRAAVLNSPYMVVCAPRFKTFNIKGDLKFFNGTYTAAYIAGLIASFTVGEPITNKDISGMQALSTYFKNRQILQLIDNGVCIIERVGSALKVVQGVTSWISDDNFNKKEISVRLVTNYIAKNCRANLRQFIGRKNSPQILQIIKGSLVQVLRELENNEIIVGTVAYPAYRNLVLTADGDVVRVSFECSPVLPINYIVINIHATVFRATI